MTAKKLSSLLRNSYLEEMKQVPLDVLVIGGGITGAGAALDAASRGLKVGLVEKHDFGSGTSSRSTKLIHGGLRYLKQGEIKLVQEVGRERAILYRNAPHLVIPEKMLLPLVKNGTYGRLATSFGLWLYDLLAGVEKRERRVMLSRAETEEIEPLLRKNILKGAGIYYEYRTDDARLTIEVMKTAAAHGAYCLNYMQVTDFEYQHGKLAGVKVTDKITGQSHLIYAKKIVSAAGPWADKLREKDHLIKGKKLHLTKGVHIVVPYDRLPVSQSVYFDVPDGRMVFAIPRDNCTYIGTTDTHYYGDIDQPDVTKDDVDYILQAANHMFPTVNLTEADITSSWSGLRPLIHEEGKSPSELSRKDEIFISDSGLITIAGGKLTGYRKMAERVIDLVMSQLQDEYGMIFVKGNTAQITLSGGDFLDNSAPPEKIKRMFNSYVNQIIKHSVNLDLTKAQVTALFYKYGSQTEAILEHVKTLQQEMKELPNQRQLNSEQLIYNMVSKMKW
jgi:glycerol-3-phosphate dehydrogenase